MQPSASSLAVPLPWADSAATEEVRLEPGVLPELTQRQVPRLILDAHDLQLVDSRLIARLLEMVRLSRPGAVVMRRACARIRVQFAQLGLDRIIAIEG